MVVHASCEQGQPHRCAALHHTRAASQRGEQPYLKLHAARAKLSPALNQLVRFVYPDTVFAAETADKSRRISAWRTGAELRNQLLLPNKCSM